MSAQTKKLKKTDWYFFGQIGLVRVLGDQIHKYKYTNTVLLAESGQPKDPVDRNFLAAELNLTETASSKQVPILYGVLSHFLEQRNNSVPERDVNNAVPPRATVQPRGTENIQSDIDVEPDYDYSSAKGMVYHSKK